MKITILNDNNAGKYCSAEHGLSYLVESDISFLFDTGPSDIICRNAEKLGINLNSIETIILSHRHYDHSNGLLHLKGKCLICHPLVFEKNYRKSDGNFIGMPFTIEEAKNRFFLIKTIEPYHVSENVIFLGEIPRLNNFEAKTTGFKDEFGCDDFIHDDSGVAIKSKKGLIIISGCAHSGICNIVEHAISVANENNVYAVMGGFHLKEDNKQIKETIDYLKSKKVEKVIPSHCTELPALSAIYKEWPFRQIKSGQVIQF